MPTIRDTQATINKNIYDQNRINLERQAGYDMQGYIDKYGIPDQSKGQHLTDEFKLPHHITFSDESIYSSGETPGGKWQMGPDKTWHFYASPFNLQQHSADELQKYFRTREPDSVLHLPGE